MNLQNLFKTLIKAGAEPEHIETARKDWRPRWFFLRVTERQFRDAQDRLLPRPKPSYPPSLTNHNRVVEQRARRQKELA